MAAGLDRCPRLRSAVRRSPPHPECLYRRHDGRTRRRSANPCAEDTHGLRQVSGATRGVIREEADACQIGDPGFCYQGCSADR
jgi:hypothetical protein